jgi:hypothetical protein
MHHPSQNTDGVVVHHRALVLDGTGDFVAKPAPVFFLSGQVLGTLIVYEDMGFIHHELVLIDHRLKGVGVPPVLLGGGGPGSLDQEEKGLVVAHRLRQRVDDTVAKVLLKQEAVYYIVQGAVCERHDDCLALAASKAGMIH